MPSLRRLARVPIPRTAGEVAVALYLVVLVRLAADGSIRPAALASSPAGVANGHLVRLLTSGLVIDGPTVPQIVALGVTLAVALRRLGPARTWRTALVAHVGATVAAYGGVALLAVVDRELVTGVVHAPDYGISVVLTGELGALAAAHRSKLMPPAIVVLTSITAATCLGAHRIDSLTLANLEHLLGFLIGAAFSRLHPPAATSGAGAPDSPPPPDAAGAAQQREATNNGRPAERFCARGVPGPASRPRPSRARGVWSRQRRAQDQWDSEHRPPRRSSRSGKRA